jgi:hypothetical protein
MSEDLASTENIFQIEPEELRQLKEAATLLADMSDVDRSYWLPKRAEQIGVVEKVLKSAVAAELRERAIRTAAENLAKDRERQQLEKQRLVEQKELERARKEKAREQRETKQQVDREKREAKKQADQEKRRAEKEAEREARKAAKAAEKKEKEKAKAFGVIMRLPVDRHMKELERLAGRLGKDITTLREEFEECLGVGTDTAAARTEPWDEPVDIAVLLQECRDKIFRYVAADEHIQTTSVLWAAHCWFYDHGVPVHSPLLAATSAEPDSGKSTLIAVLGRATPRFSLNIEITGPSLYRWVDAIKPTLGLDEADDLFTRKPDLKHIINAGWTRNAKIPRQVSVGRGVYQPVLFDPFTPKMIALLGRNLPRATGTRRIELRMLPKRADEIVELFNQQDDPEFAVIRRKLARFAADNAATLKDAKPTIPTELNNRVAMNWILLLAIAEAAGGRWPEQARAAAVRLSRRGRQPSDGAKLLAAIKTMAIKFVGKEKVITSETIAADLNKDPTDIWIAYNRGGPITQRQIAHLLSAYDIHPDTVHPSGRSWDSRKGYKYEQFTDAFARYLPNDPDIRTPNKTGSKRKPATPRKRRRKR